MAGETERDIPLDTGDQLLKIFSGDFTAPTRALLAASDDSTGLRPFLRFASAFDESTSPTTAGIRRAGSSSAPPPCPPFATRTELALVRVPPVSFPSRFTARPAALRAAMTSSRL